MRTKKPNNKGRVSVLRAYRKDPRASLVELSQASGMSKTTVYYPLSQLENEGVVTRNHYVGKPAGTISKSKYSSEVTRLKKAEAGRRGRGDGVFTPKKSKKDTGLQDRIELVVRMAREQEARGDRINATDVVMHSPIRLSGAQKVG